MTEILRHFDSSVPWKLSVEERHAGKLIWFGELFGIKMGVEYDPVQESGAAWDKNLSHVWHVKRPVGSIDLKLKNVGVVHLFRVYSGTAPSLFSAARLAEKCAAELDLIKIREESKT